MPRNSLAGRKQLNSALSLVEREYQQAITPVIEQTQGIVINATGRDGDLDRERLRRDRIRLGDAIERFFVGQTRLAYGQDGETPQSDFARILNWGYVKAVYDQVSIAHDWLQRRTPNDIYAYLRNSTRSLGIQELTAIEWHQVRVQIVEYRMLAALPGSLLYEDEDSPFLQRDDEPLEDYQERVDDLRIFRPNPMAELDPFRRWVPMHRWQDERGYQLSDRIWQNSQEVRQKIDKLITRALSEGWSAVRLANQLKQYLQPGGKAAYNALRLARSEIARAANQAAFLSAYLNPYVGGMDIARSATGDPNCPVCPRFATIGIGGGRVRDPYPVQSTPIPIFHPFCKCNTRGVVRDNPREITRRLRATMQSNVTPAVNPANRQALLIQMLGPRMMALLAQLT